MTEPGARARPVLTASGMTRRARRSGPQIP